MALTGKQERAAALVADGSLSYPEICKKLKIGSRVTLLAWRRTPEFEARVAELRAEMRAAVREKGIAITENRVAALQERWELMQQVITERSEDPINQEVAGGKTGLLAHTVKGIGSGGHFQLIDIWEVDTGLLRELRAHEEQAAKDLGQWIDRKDVTGTQRLEITGVEVDA